MRIIGEYNQSIPWTIWVNVSKCGTKTNIHRNRKYLKDRDFWVYDDYSKRWYLKAVLYKPKYCINIKECEECDRKFS